MPSFLLTWHPDHWKWHDYADVAKRVAAGKSVTLQWSAGGTKQIKKGDRLFLLRQGVEPRGIVGSGWATTDWYEDQHYDPTKAAEGGTTTYVDMRLDGLIDVNAKPNKILSAEELRDLIPGLNISVQRSGTQIDPDIAIGVEQMWQWPKRLDLPRNPFPKGITQRDILDAINYFKSHNLPVTFAESTDFDLVVDGERMPPKVIAGLAARRLRGRLMFSQEFSGGIGTSCFRLLENNGFTIEPKPGHDGAVLDGNSADIEEGENPTVLVERLVAAGHRFWWVNQNQTFKPETTGGYLWSPKRKSNGDRNPFYEFMREVKPGDVVLSFCDTEIPAIGIATSHAYEAAKPNEFGSTGSNWEHVGWRIDVRYQMVEKPICPKNHIDELRPLLPSKYAPLGTDGNGKQAVYLTELPADLFAKLLELIMNAGNAVSIPRVAPIPAPNRDLEFQRIETEIQEQITQDDSIGATEKEQIVLARRGQGRFKQNLVRFEPQCRVTGIAVPEYLIASHMKPWRSCNNQERLNGANGLLLAPHIDFLFDRGLISFSDDGDLLISPAIDHDTLQRFHVPIDGSMAKRPFTDQQKPYIAYHRHEVFLRSDRGE